VGNLTAHRLADGNINTFTYNNRNWRTGAAYFDGQSTAMTYSPDGKPLTITDTWGVTTYRYDSLDRVAEILTPDGRNVSYEYDANGQRTAMTTPLGTTEYRYDILSRLIEVEDPSGEATSYSYTPTGMLDNMLYPNGVVSDYSYNSLDRLTQVEQRTGASLLARYSYTLDAAGQRTAMQEADGTRYVWEYDPAYRLTREGVFAPDNTPLSNTTWAYDSMGNRLSQTQDGISTFYTYNTLDQLVSSESGGALSTYSYDPRGNLLQTVSPTGTTTYTWDARDRMTGVVLPDTSMVSYVYDHENRRVASTEAGATTSYLWDRLSAYGDVLAEYDSTGAVVVEYTLGLIGLISQKTSADQEYFLTDGQGNTRLTLNSQGNIVSRYSYDAFGNMIEAVGNTSDYLYSGHSSESSIGLYYMRARFYDPTLGRFLSRDPYPASLQGQNEYNRYAYVASNPINYSDPSGMSIMAEIGKIYDHIRSAGSYISKGFSTPFGEGALAGFFGYIFGVAAIVTADVVIKLAKRTSVSSSNILGPTFLLVSSPSKSEVANTIWTSIKRWFNPIELVLAAFFGGLLSATNAEDLRGIAAANNAARTATMNGILATATPEAPVAALTTAFFYSGVAGAGESLDILSVYASGNIFAAMQTGLTDTISPLAGLTAQSNIFDVMEQSTAAGVLGSLNLAFSRFNPAGRTARVALNTAFGTINTLLGKALYEWVGQQ
jgi:RHS repeat-associated protein